MNRQTRVPGVAAAVSLTLLLAPVTACELATVGGANSRARSVDGIDCDAVVGSPSRQASLEFFDIYRPPAGVDVDIPLELRLDGCLIGESENRGLALGLGFLPGERTLSVVVDGEELAPEALSAEEDDVFLYALDTESPPRLHAARDTKRFLKEGWLVNLMNMSGGDMDVYRVVDPDASDREYVLLADGVPHGEMFNAELAASEERGAWIRIERAGEAIFEDNIGEYVMPCDDGEWPAGGVQTFWTIEDSGPSSGASYQEDMTLCREDD